MKKLVIAAFAAPLALAACAQEETVAEKEGAEMQMGETTTVPAVTTSSQINETRNATNQGTGRTADGRDVTDGVLEESEEGTAMPADSGE